MDIYGQAAVAVAKNYRLGQDPRQCWEYEVGRITDKKSYIEKGCPKSAFLGLCEAGYVKGIPEGKYTRGYKNKKYAIAAAKVILASNGINYDSETLWQKIKEYVPERCDTPNFQVEVVLALKEAGFLQVAN